MLYKDNLIAVMDDELTGYHWTVNDDKGNFVKTSDYDGLRDEGFKHQKLYIKFEEGNKESLEMACKEAERLGYSKLNDYDAIDFEGYGLLKLNSDGKYFTANSAILILLQGYKEHKIEEEKNKVEKAYGRENKKEEKSIKEDKGYRQFSTGSTRDTSNGKLEYSNYIHPLNDYSFSKYMQSKQIIGGKYRRGDNWVSGLPYESLFDSLCRHIEVLKLLYKGHSVVEVNKDGVVELLVDVECEGDHKTIESELNAIRFNSEAMKLQYITGNIVKE